VSPIVLFVIDPGSWSPDPVSFVASIDSDGSTALREQRFGHISGGVTNRTADQ
jgi:hypothetical protein